MTTTASQITSLTVVYSTVYSDADKKNIKAPRHCPLCGEVTGTGEFPAQRASYAENVPIWWRHHVLQPVYVLVCDRIISMYVFNITTEQTTMAFYVFCSKFIFSKLP